MATKCEHCPLRRKPLFVDFQKSELEFMKGFKVGEMTVDPGTPILSEGTNTPQIFTALSGMGLRYKLLEDGRRQVVNFVFPGDFLGLQAGVMNEMKHSVEATTAMTLCVFDRSALWSLFRASPSLGFDLTWLASTGETFLGETLTSIGQRNATERVSWALLKIFKQLEGVGQSNGDHAPFPFRQQDLADALGLSLVHTNKTLARLRDKQLVSWMDGVIHMLDMDRLISEAMIDEPELDKRPFI